MNELSDELIRLIYGDDIDVLNLRRTKDTSEIWKDIILYLANNDITKIKEIEEMRFIDILEILQSKVKLKTVPKKKQNPVGFKFPNQKI